ncbi:von Willebrand and RING finger domain-containing protein [Viridothelium virens]|uniref:von Willebrand and RING finger domain-containing protein n=1 Tax=Viridothelium virens TaxID=1048519 RepID=A0A6A6HD14_VIRVR|nr:von Willebrand and RING finger domain-containing protein [Viridothelium virens]
MLRSGRSKDSFTPHPASSRRPSYSRQNSAGDTRPPFSPKASTVRRPSPGALPRTGSRGMAGVLDLERSRTRRDRTFIGAECAVCEEPLEHTLRGERILQFSCQHVSHEACFYEYLREYDAQACPTCEAPLGLDSSRGGNVLDLSKLQNLVRSVQSSDEGRRSGQATPQPWDSDSTHRRNDSRQGQRETLPRRNYRDSDERYDQRSGSYSRAHARNDSGATGMASSAGEREYTEAQHALSRRHDYDVSSMETNLSSPRSHAARNPIPPPNVTVRTEFPTLTRSRQQQSVTCLVTVEVMEGKWRPSPDDIRAAPPMPAPRPDEFQSPQSPQAGRQRLQSIYESQEALDDITEELHSRVENWHGLDFSRFGKLRLHGAVRVGKDRQSWQELECYLFSDMLICVKEKKPQAQSNWDGGESDVEQRRPRCTLKGSILIKKHLKQVNAASDASILTLTLSVTELPQFHLQFQNRSQLDMWKKALLDINAPEPQLRMQDFDQDNSGTDEEDYRNSKTTNKRLSSVNSSYGANRSTYTAPTEYSNPRGGMQEPLLHAPSHVPIDIVVVIPVSSSMQGLKITLLRDTLRFMVQNLGDKDRMGLVTFGSSGGGVPLVGMSAKSWSGWSKILESVKPVGQKSLRADVVEGANVAMDLLMQRKASNPLSSIMLISDSSTSDPESVDFVVSRAEAAKVTIHSFGLGLTHKPDTMIELSSRTKASYSYVKDWMMLRECVAGCLGSLQTISHQNVKLKLRLPEGSPAKFVKTSGALQVTKRATGRDVEALLGDLRFGDKRDILVQLAIAPDATTSEQVPQDHWETIVSGLEALGGASEFDDNRTLSVEEVPLIQADLVYGDILREGVLGHFPRPSLLAITMLPALKKSRTLTPPIPPHPSVVQRRMELLTSDMLTRALTLVSRGQHERAHHLLHETRSILKGLGKGGLPPLPPPPKGNLPPPPAGAPKDPNEAPSSNSSAKDGEASNSGEARRTPSPPHFDASNAFTPATGIDATTMAALDAELESSLEWINHPAVFSRDSRKAVLQAIGVISSQRAYTFRSPSEALWAGRIPGIRRLAEKSREWREGGDESLMEEA